MGFKEITALDADVTTALGGRNKKTGKANPTKAEGYYLGSRSVESKKSKTGFAKIHFLQTEKGNLGIWGKTDLDRKMSAVPVGALIRITQSGMTSTPNGEMYKFRVEVDTENTIEVNVSNGEENSEDASAGPGYAENEVDAYSGLDEEESEVDSEEEALDEVPPARAAAPRQPAATPDAVRQAKVKALLSGKRQSAS